MSYEGDSGFQQLTNYYTGLIVYNSGRPRIPVDIQTVRRIISSKYLGFDGTVDRMQLTVFNSFSDNFAYNSGLFIADTTDFSDPNFPLIFVPSGQLQDDAYIKYILYNETINQFRPIKHYDIATHLILLDTTTSTISTPTSGPIDTSWTTTDSFSLRLSQPMEPPLNTIYPLLVLSGSTIGVIQVSDTSNILSQISDTSTTTSIYKNQFLRILPYKSGAPNYSYNYDPVPSNNKSRRIVNYTYTAGVGIFTVSPSFTTIPTTDSPIEILKSSYDNVSPFRFSGSLVSNQQSKCYQLQLLSITLPNITLNTSFGGSLSMYPYIYVEISSATSGSNKNIIYTNNPNANKAIFRCVVYDINNYLNTPFTRITGDSEIQTIKFKPNDNLYFRVYLENGNDIKTVLPEFYSPNAPNPQIQISILLSIK